MSTTDIAILVAATVLGAFVKSVTGLGLPLVTVPIATLFMPQPLVVAALAFPNLVQNLTLMWQTRAERSQVPGLAIFVGSGLVGALFGAIAVPHVDERALVIALIAIIGVFLVMSIRPQTAVMKPDEIRRWQVPIGTMSGAFQGSIGISGPLVVAWFQRLGLGRNAFVFALSTTFGLSGAVQVGVYAIQGRITAVLGTSLLLLVVVLVTVPIGYRVRSHLNAETFRRIVIGLVFITWLLLIGRLLTD